MSEIKITPSCGCIFCDLGLEPERLKNGVRRHKVPRGTVVCGRGKKRGRPTIGKKPMTPAQRMRRYRRMQTTW